jgi:hypothetical protein
MDQNNVTFPQITNRESWNWTLAIYDDDTGDLVNLVDGNKNPLYAITVEISRMPNEGGHGYGGPIDPSYYDDWCGPEIVATLANYITIPDNGTIAVNIPKAVMSGLRAKSYGVFMTLYDASTDTGRQIFIARLPVLYGGRNT